MAVQKNVKKDAPAAQEVKAVETVETKKAVTAPAAKVEAPAAAPKAAEEKKAAEPKKAAKAAAPKKAAKAAAPAAEKMEEIVIQYGVMEWKGAELMERAKAAYVAEGHRAAGIKSVSLYVKPEERKAYYVINEKTTGSIDL